MGTTSLRSAERAERHARGSYPRPARAIDSTPELDDGGSTTSEHPGAPERARQPVGPTSLHHRGCVWVLRAGAGTRPLGAPTERLTFTAEERELLDRLTRDTPEIVQSMAGDVADALRQAMPAVQPLMSGARDVDVFLVALVDQVVDRGLRAGDPWGADESARRRLLDLLARHCVACVRKEITTRLLAAGEH